MPTTATRRSIGSILARDGLDRLSGGGALLAEDLLLLVLELGLGEDALVAEIGEALELVRDRRRRGRRAAARAALVHPLLVRLTLLVDRALDVLGAAHV